MSDWKDDFTEHAKVRRVRTEDLAGHAERSERDLNATRSHYQREANADSVTGNWVAIGQIVHTPGAISCSWSELSLSGDGFYLRIVRKSSKFGNVVDEKTTYWQK